MMHLPGSCHCDPSFLIGTFGTVTSKDISQHISEKKVLKVVKPVAMPNPPKPCPGPGPYPQEPTTQEEPNDPEEPEKKIRRLNSAIENGELQIWTLKEEREIYRDRYNNTVGAADRGRAGGGVQATTDSIEKLSFDQIRLKIQVKKLQDLRPEGTSGTSGMPEGASGTSGTPGTSPPLALPMPH